MSLPSPIRQVLDGQASSVNVTKSGPGSRALLAGNALAAGRSVVYLVRDARELRETRALLALLGSDAGKPVWERQWVVMPPFPAGGALGARGERTAASFASDWAERMACLFALARGTGPRGILLTVDNFLPYLPPRELLDLHHAPLAVGDDMSPDILLDQAVVWGYERVTLVTRPGEMSMRGDILDIFTPGYEVPLRIEFFGDVVEEIRLFDPVSQRSKGALHEVMLLPVSPLVTSAAFAETALASWARMEKDGVLSDNEAYEFRRRLERGDVRIPPGLYYADPSRMEQWLPRDAVYFLSSPEALRTALTEEYWAWCAALHDEGEPDRNKLPPMTRHAVRSHDAAHAVFEDAPRVVFEELVMGTDRHGLDLPERRIASHDDLFRDVDAQERKERPWHCLVAALKAWQAANRQTLLAFHSARSRRKFMDLAEQEGIRPWLEYSSENTGLFALVSPVQGGHELGWAATLILGEDIIQPKGAARKAPPPRDFTGLKRFDDLEPGTLLVHRDYGLGRFVGLERMDMGGVGNDYLLLHYTGQDKLYLPVDRLGLVQRYAGPEGEDPALDRLGGMGWLRSCDKARKAIEQIARDLVEMYAYRRIAKGYSYGDPGELYREFEASFGFEETPDQARAIQQVFMDMERPEPMDRLVCGDVGFGKTEIAMRAAFRATVDGKQVALLCPTTVLAEQHYQNFRSRFHGFPINVAMLSRFVPKAKQKTVLDAAARGQVDILIGTHRLLSKDVKLPNLGLLVLDEEQRFGVRHKERLKEMRRNVDALTLTATPIPRTLQLSLSGVRDLSVIETPPLERKAVDTALIERDAGLLRTVLAREIAREGQVFWVYNRVQGLDQVCRFVQELVPSARVGMAHGQMAERALEETMHAFWHGELDVLVCTSIVESGLDFPRANTLIVDQAQMFGLGQLYQIRGRVGRSERQAYAYFVVNDVSAIPEMARKRLQVVLDMDYLGAGFQVAMEDLRLRGAGNILGETQSGHIAKVGLDLFLEMLEDEVSRLKGEPSTEITDPECGIGFPAHIPEAYMADAKERLKYYKALSSARDPETRDDLMAEIRDRFGPSPLELHHFLAVLAFKDILGELQVVKAELHPGRIRLTWAEKTSKVGAAQLVEWVAARPGRARLLPPALLELRLDESVPLEKRLADAGDALALLAEAPARKTVEGTHSS